MNGSPVAALGHAAQVILLLAAIGALWYATTHATTLLRDLLADSIGQ